MPLQSQEGVLFFLLNGRDMMNLFSMQGEIVMKLRFPEWAGMGWDAMIDMFSYLEQFYETPGLTKIVIGVESGHLVLQNALNEDRETFFEIMDFIGDDWATPIQRGEWWDRPAVDFKVVLFD